MILKKKIGFVFLTLLILIAGLAINTVSTLKNGKGSAAESILSDMLTKQTTSVDAISGATISSKVIRKAVENSLSSS